MKEVKKMTIGEVSKAYAISIDTLRYYEKVGLIGPIPKNKSGIRDFNEENLRQVEFVKCMRGANLSIEALSRYMKLFKQGADTLEQRRAILVKQREAVIKQMEELEKAKEKLDYKITLYDNQLLEKKLKGE